MYLTVEEVAIRLRVKPGNVYRWCKMGLIAHTRLGTARGPIRVTEDDLQAFIDKGARASSLNGRLPVADVPHLLEGRSCEHVRPPRRKTKQHRPRQQTAEPPRP